MDFDLDESQRALRDTARRFLENEAPVSYAREMMEDPRGFRDDVWKRMASLGWTAVPFPEAYGGAGEGFIALAILLAEMGRVVLPGPYLSTVALAGAAILEAGDAAQRAALLPPICSGEEVGTLAVGLDPAWTADSLGVEARPEGEGWRLYGEARLVPDGATAYLQVVVARAPQGPALFAVRGDEGVSASPARTMDQTRKVADVRYEGAPAERLGTGEATAIERVRDRAAAALAAEMLGGAERVLELSVDYAKARVQFDRPIGSFQAVKHRAADMLLDVESMRNAVYYAAWALERGHPDAPLAASMAKAYCSDAFRRVASSGIQIHGGIGFTWEADLHLYFKRAKASEVAFGDAVWHRERIARVLRARYAPVR